MFSFVDSGSPAALFVTGKLSMLPNSLSDAIASSRTFFEKQCLTQIWKRGKNLIRKYTHLSITCITAHDVTIHHTALYIHFNLQMLMRADSLRGGAA